MKTKLKNKKGFSISELLMVVLILSLIIVILGGGLTVVLNAYNRITLKAEAQTLLSTAITQVSDEFRFASDIDTGDNGHVTFLSATQGCQVYFTNDTSESKRGILIGNTVNTTDTATLLTDKTQTSGLYTEIDDYQYDDQSQTFDATITVRNSSGDKVVSQNIIVRPLN